MPTFLSWVSFHPAVLYNMEHVAWLWWHISNFIFIVSCFWFWSHSCNFHDGVTFGHYTKLWLGFGHYRNLWSCGAHVVPSHFQATPSFPMLAQYGSPCILCHTSFHRQVSRNKIINKNMLKALITHAVWLHSVYEIAVPTFQSPLRSWWGLVLA